MHVINARNVQQALPEAIRHLLVNGRRRESRNGPVLKSPVPVTTCYRRPTERVVFWELRDANPFFHLMESLWMLGGRRDVAFPGRFAANIGSYSDDGKVFHAAYGHRWRKAFGFDQLKRIAANLKANPDDRRQVLGIWAPQMDLDVSQGQMLDLPCNLAATFQVEDGAVDMTVFNRSNDIVWGCYGANAVHFSFLLEYVAARAGLEVGRYWQTSVNWHGYLKTLEPLAALAEEVADPFHARYVRDPYEDMSEELLVPLLGPGEDPDTFDVDVDMFLDEGLNTFGYRSRFIRRVAVPMLVAWTAFKGSRDPARYDEAIGTLENCQAADWRTACVAWLVRRKEKAVLATTAAAKAT